MKKVKMGKEKGLKELNNFLKTFLAEYNICKNNQTYALDFAFI